MQNTRDRYLSGVVGWPSPGLRALVYGALIVLALGWLAACGVEGGEARPPAPTDTPVVIISTVKPSQEPATATPALPPPTATPTPTPTPPLAAIVNGQCIYLADYERRLAQYEQSLLPQGAEASSPEVQETLADLGRRVLEDMIDNVLIQQRGDILGVTVSEAEVEAQIEADIAAGGGQAAFDEWLQATGQTRQDYKDALREAMLAQRMFEFVTADVQDVAEQVHVRHIQVDSEQAAQEIVALLREGADFAALARERSQDPATSENGGDLGWFPRGWVTPELEAAAFALQPGGISDVVQFGGAYHIIQVVEREAARALTAEMQVDLRVAIFERWLAEQRAAAVIERFVGE